MHRLHAIAITGLVAVFVLGTAGVASATDLGVNFDNTGHLVSSSTANIGWEFSIANPIVVTELGFWDCTLCAGTGLGEAHDVAIWSSSGLGDLGSALVSGTVAAGTGAPFAPGSQFRMVDVADVVLVAGTYVVAARIPTQADVYVDDSAGSEVFGPGITWNRRLFSGSVSFERPGNSDAKTGGVYGPTFSYVPEPSTGALLGLGVVALGGLRGRRGLARRAA